MTPEDLYNKWLNLFINEGIPFDIYPDIIKFDDYNVYTPFTYKFTFNLGFTNSGIYYKYKLKEKDYKLFADLFFIDGWKDELEHVTNLDNIMYDGNKLYKTKYSINYGDINCYVKPWVDYVTFQGYRTIVQFRWDKYSRKEKLLKINQENDTV